jgi:putative transposase
VKKQNKAKLARALGISRSLLYYEHKQPKKDWLLKQNIEEVLHEFPSYGCRRIAEILHIDKDHANRVMRIFGIKPYRRRVKKYRRSKKNWEAIYPNLLLFTEPAYINHIWVCDFTHLNFHGKKVYVATVMDVFSRKIVGLSVLLKHTVELSIGALLCALQNNSPPKILHSDQGSEYTAKDYTAFAHEVGITLSMSRRASPWENGYQESFYNGFKVDLGDPNRFEILGELVSEIHRTVYRYNNKRIHTAFMMPPAEFARRHLQKLHSDKVSKEMGT